MTAGDDASAVVHERFTSTDLDEVEQYFSDTYAEITMSPTGDPAGFSVHHETSTVGGIALGAMRTTLGWTCAMAPLRGALVVDHVRGGRLRWESDRYGEVRGAAGSTTLLPPADEITNVTSDADLEIVSLDRADVERYALAVCGVEELTFTDLAPRTRRLRDHWRATVAHVRDDLFAAPEIAANPIFVDSAFRLLASVALTTFPNTALAAITEPSAPAPHGAVPEPVLRDVVDYLHTHAGRPLRPAEVAGLADAPTREVDHALRRRRNTTTATELWRARLDGVRRDLHTADPGGGVTVVEIARRWGFANHRAFTAAYSTAFGGETPEQTLRR